MCPRHSQPRQLDYWIDGARYLAFPLPTAGSYAITRWGDNHHVCVVSKEGSRWVTSSHPGKKWTTLGQAIEYTLTMRNA